MSVYKIQQFLWGPFIFVKIKLTLYPQVRNSITQLTLVDALCNWRRGDDILEMIIDWLNKDLKNKKENCEMSKPKNKVKLLRGIDNYLGTAPKALWPLWTTCFSNNFFDLNFYNLGTMLAPYVIFHSENICWKNKYKKFNSKPFCFLPKTMLLKKEYNKLEKDFEHYSQVKDWESKDIFFVNKILATISVGNSYGNFFGNFFLFVLEFFVEFF